MILRSLRSVRAEQADGGGDGRRWWIRTLPFDVIDEMGTMFAPTTVERVMARPPKFLYGHQKDDVHSLLGVARDARVAEGALDLLMELLDPEQVPAAAVARAALRDGAMDGFSVGGSVDLERADEVITVDRSTGAVRFELYEVDEVSGTPVPAVPGTGVLTRQLLGQQGGAPRAPERARQLVEELQAHGWLDAGQAEGLLTRAAVLTTKNTPVLPNVPEKPEEPGQPEGAGKPEEPGQPGSAAVDRVERAQKLLERTREMRRQGML